MVTARPKHFNLDIVIILLGKGVGDSMGEEDRGWRWWRLVCRGEVLLYLPVKVRVGLDPQFLSSFLWFVGIVGTISSDIWKWMNIGVPTKKGKQSDNRCLKSTKVNSAIWIFAHQNQEWSPCFPFLVGKGCQYLRGFRGAKIYSLPPISYIL